MTVHSENNRYLHFGILGMLTLAALLIRAPGLGKWCITSDEYFLSRSISFIQESGLPKFPSGGYYVRGILLQYLMTVPVQVIPDREFALRLIPLIFGVLTIPMVYLFCRNRMPVLPSLLCSAMLLFSSWQIEFSRFARFYSVFQFVFFVYLYLLYRGYCEHKRTFRYYSWAIAALAVFVFEGAIFLPFLLLMVVIMQEENIFIRKNGEVFLVFISLMILNYLVNGIDYKNWGVRNRLPVTAIPDTGHGFWDNLPFVLPPSDILAFSWGSYWSLILYFLVLGMGVYVFRLFFRQIQGEKETWIWLFVMLVLILPLFHLYGLLGILSIILFINRSKAYFFFRRNWKILTFYWIISGVYWTGLILLSGNPNKLMHYLFGYPSVKSHIITPFSESVPFFGMVAASILFLSVMYSFFAKRDPSRLFVLNIVAICLLLVSVFKVPERTTRYCFFFFPLVFVLAHQDMNSLVEWIRQKKGQSAPACFGGVLFSIPFFLFVATEEFHPAHILNVASRETNFRIEKYAGYKEHWYERFDYESPAEYVNRHFSKGDEVVIDSNPFSDYLRTPAHFFSPTDIYWFPQFSRNFGTLEVWSGYPMISTVSSIAGLVPKNNKNVLWLVTKEQISSGDWVFDIAKKYGLRVDRDYTGVDDRFKVWKITRNDAVKRSGFVSGQDQSFLFDGSDRKINTGAIGVGTRFFYRAG